MHTSMYMLDASLRVSACTLFLFYKIREWAKWTLDDVDVDPEPDPNCDQSGTPGSNFLLST
jgi:hypothetical protein